MALPDFSPYVPSQLTRKEPIAQDQIIIEVQPPEGALMAYRRPGQFCRLRVAAANGELHESIFALMSTPAEKTFRFLVRTGNPVGGEGADRLAELDVGSPVEITLPTGDGFALERARGRDLYFVATGTAIAPVRAAIDEVLLDRASYGALSLDLGLRGPEYLAVASEIERWTEQGMTVRMHYSILDDAGNLQGVRVQDAVLGNLGELTRAAFVAVGQSSMVKELRARVAELGGDPSLVLHNY